MAKRSPIWKYFEVASDERFAICKLCNKSVARGGKDKKSYTTTNVVKHLESCNRSKYSEYLKNKEDEDAKRKEIRQAKPLRQIILEESQDRVKVWDINDPRAKKTHQLIGEMIALDTQPFSIVEDVGFTRLLHCLEARYQLPSRKYVTYTVLPKIKAGMDVEVKKRISCVESINLTTDIWSTDLNNESLLTAHWLTDNFQRYSAVLHAQVLDESHTSEYTGLMIDSMLETWEISKASVHLVFRGNG